MFIKSIYEDYGIYAIRNKVTDMYYIGQTFNNFGDRWDCHKAVLRGNYHHNTPLQKDWNYYGEDNFEFIIIYNCVHGENQEELESLEESYIKEYKLKNKAYNLSNGKHDMRSFVTKEMVKRTGDLNRQRLLGTKLPESTKKKMSETRKRKFAEMTDEERKAYNEKFVKNMIAGRSEWTDERREQYSRSQWEHPHSAKLTHEQVREIRRLYEKENLRIKDISVLMGINYGTVFGIVHYKRWAHLK